MRVVTGFVLRGGLQAILLALVACAHGPTPDDARTTDAPFAADSTHPASDAPDAGAAPDARGLTDAPAQPDAASHPSCDPFPGGVRSSAMASSTLWPVAAAIDGDPASIWSSATHATAQNVESVTVNFGAPQPINYVVLVPRTDAAGHGLGFPVEFTVEWSNGTTWAAARGFTHYPRPTSSCVALTLSDTVTASAIRVTARVLGDDGVGNYVFQLGELDAGHDPARDGVVRTTDRATGSTALWAEAGAFDGDPSTAWSSVTHATAASTESLAYWWADLQPVNYVQWTPRFDAATGRAQGFPVAFDVLYSDGSHWVMAQHYAGFPTPHDNMQVVLPLGSTVVANGIQIVATTLGQDALGNDVFQMAEVSAGLHPGYELLRFGGNNGASGRNEIGNVGSESVDRPEQLANWNYDARGIVLPPAVGPFQNIYAPSVVHTTGTGWNVYFGGWDGSPTQNDRLYRTSTGDDFLSFGAHALIVDHGAFVHTNNDCALRVADGDWRIVYTADAALNKPAWSHSSDGLTWSPGVGSTSSLFAMTGYPNWGAADVNGGNVVIQDAGTWHLYFDDFAAPLVVHHATSTDFVNWAYQGHALEHALVMNDLKSFAYGGSRYYVGLYHINSQHIWMTVGTSLTALADPTVAFDNAGAADMFIVAVGMVQDGSRIYGALYGAGAVSTLDHNRIFARWLQKRVIFQNARVRWGDIEQALGPDRVYLFSAAADSVETGRFDVYDSDGTTLLFRSPTVTMRAGDVWNYRSGY